MKKKSIELKNRQIFPKPGSEINTQVDEDVTNENLHTIIQTDMHQHSIHQFLDDDSTMAAHEEPRNYDAPERLTDALGVIPHEKSIPGSTKNAKKKKETKSSAEFTLPRGVKVVNASHRGSIQLNQSRRLSGLMLDSKQETLPIKQSSTTVEKIIQQTDRRKSIFASIKEQKPPTPSEMSHNVDYLYYDSEQEWESQHNDEDKESPKKLSKKKSGINIEERALSLQNLLIKDKTIMSS